MDKKITISLCMIVKDEGGTLERCLSSANSFVDEIIIVDTGSKDNTKDIARKFDAKIFDFKWVDDFALARNFSFSKATSEYIMWLDGDDFIDKENQENIKSLLLNFDKSYDYVSGAYVLGRNPTGEINYSLRRNRIVRRSMNFKWIGHVHEYLEVYGNGLAGNFSIEHGKIKSYSNRNLQIFRSMEKRKVVFTPRDLLYYGNELRDNGFYKEAIKNYRKFLATKLGWIEDIKMAYSKIIDCYRMLDIKDDIPKTAFESFQVDIPRADICCSLGEYYLIKDRFKESAFWYRVALDCRHENGNIGIDSIEYYTIIPSLQLCLCYFKMGNLNCSYFFNELAGTFIADSDKVKYNRDYFKEEFKRREIEYPKIEYPIRYSDYIKYI